MALSLHLSPFANKLTGRIMNSPGRKLFTATCCDQFTMVSLRPHQSALSQPSLPLKRHDAWHVANVIDSKWSRALTMYNKQTEDVCTYARSRGSFAKTAPNTPPWTQTHPVFRQSHSCTPLPKKQSFPVSTLLIKAK